MSGPTPDSVNVESRDSPQDKRWTIMAALIGTNTALLVFQGIEEVKSPHIIREVALSVIAAALPFQAIYFLIYTYLLEHEASLSPSHIQRLRRASVLCQMIAYVSLAGVTMLWYHMSKWVGFTFILSTLLALLLVYFVIGRADTVETLLDEAI